MSVDKLTVLRDKSDVGDVDLQAGVKYENENEKENENESFESPIAQ